MPLDLLAAAHDLIALDSRSSLSNGAVVGFLAPICRAAGLEVEVLAERRDGVEQFDLVACRGESAGNSLLLATHLDTVPPGDLSLWTACEGRPFEVAERDGHLYGLGVADVKLDFLCKLAALERLRGEQLGRPIILAGTYGEEVGRFGARLLVDRLQPLPSTALVGEPSGLRPCVAHKGYVELHVHGRPTDTVPLPEGAFWELLFDGVAAHSSQTNRGRSATDACLDALADLIGRQAAVLAIEGGEVVNMVAASARAVVVWAGEPPSPAAGSCRRLDPTGAESWSPGLVAGLFAVRRSCALLRTDFEPVVGPGFDPPFSTANNGILRLDADGFRHITDIRRLPGEAPERALSAHLGRLAHLADAGLCEIVVERQLDAPPFAAAEGSEARRALEHALANRGLPLDPEHKSGTTEAPVYADAGMDTIVFGPGEAAGNIHKPNEHVPLAHLWQAIDVYADTIRALCT
jgi:acetylornithine deacetylase/succinyl-diaminopimelate desuccinylase-like protein